MYKKLVFIFLILFAVKVYAKEYAINDMVIDLDSSWTVVTRDNIKGNKLFKIINITEKDYENYMKENSVYLNAVKINKNNTISEDILICYDKISDVKNLNNYDTDYIVNESNKIAKSILDEGVTVINNGSYENELYKYIYIHYKDADKYVYFYQTGINGNAYLTMISTTKKIHTESMEYYRKNIIDKIKYNQDDTLVEGEEKTNGSYGILIIFVILIIVIIIRIITKKKKD